MRPDAIPTVSIGLPVYNGANFLAETLDSILAQTYQDFELIIVDNASTDETAEICERYAQQDGRVRYYRNEQNIGAAANYNLAFELGRGKYFKWSAHDDLIGPAFLERCVEALDQDPGVVLCFTRTIAIDDDGKQIKEFPSKRPLESPDPKRQFRGWVMDPNPVVAVFGLARREILARTRLIGKYSGSDRPLLSELSLLGRFHEVPEFLFYYRIHASQSWGGNKSHHAQQAWYDPNRKDKLTFPHWRLLSEHIKSIGRSPVNFGDRVACYGAILLWMRRNWRPLYQNLTLRDVQYRVN